MNRHDRLYDTPDDCQWLRDTALRGYADVPTFASFTIAGNEDCPIEITLYADSAPRFDDRPIAEYGLVRGADNLRTYKRMDAWPVDRLEIALSAADVPQHVQRARKTRLQQVKDERDSARTAAERYRLALFDVMTGRIADRHHARTQGDQLTFLLTRPKYDPIVIVKRQPVKNAGAADVLAVDVDVWRLDDLARHVSLWQYKDGYRHHYENALAQFRATVSKA